jgi:hypothetical protein
MGDRGYCGGDSIAIPSRELPSGFVDLPWCQSKYAS